MSISLNGTNGNSNNNNNNQTDVMLVEEDDLDPAILTTSSTALPCTTTTTTTTTTVVTSIKCGKKPSISTKFNSAQQQCDSTSAAPTRRKSTVSFAGSILNLDCGEVVTTTSTAPTKTKHSSTSSSSNRMQPINDRVRSVFDFFRYRIGGNGVPSSSGATNSDSSSKKNKKSRNSKTSKKHSSDQTKTTNKNKENQHHQHVCPKAMSPLRDDNGLDLCQLCYMPSHSCESEALLALNSSSTSNPQQLNYMYPLETCEHSFCVQCLRQYLKYQIMEARVSISCPQCSEKMHPSDIYRLLKLKVDIPNILISSPQQNTPVITTTLSSPSSSPSASPHSNHSLIVDHQHSSSSQTKTSPSTSTTSNSNTKNPEK